MSVYLVWDKLNSSREFARTIKADDPEEAAIEYAENDSDGLTDGLYIGHGCMPLVSAKYGQPICVLDGENVRTFRVAIVEFDPVFAAEEEDAVPTNQELTATNLVAEKGDRDDQ